MSLVIQSIPIRALVLCVCLAVLSGAALAADKAVATITIPNGCRTPAAIEYNGSATGTIHVLYTYVGTTFPAGYFACFNLEMAVADDTGVKDPVYPVTLTAGQIGGENVILTPANTTLTASGVGQPVGGSPVSYIVSINPAVATTPGLNDDGDTIVGNLRITASDNQLRTVTNVLVKILLVHPAVTNCLKTYHEILHKDTFLSVASMEVNIPKSGNFAGKVNVSDPPGILDSVLVVNTCAVPHSFDLLLAPSSYFEVQTAPPGNSIFLYSAAGSQTFSYFATIPGAPRGTAYCVGNLTVPPDWTLLTTAALKIIKGTPKTNLPNSGNCSPWASGCVFNFSASLVAAGSNCAGAPLPSPPVSANPVVETLPFTTP